MSSCFGHCTSLALSMGAGTEEALEGRDMSLDAQGSPPPSRCGGWSRKVCGGRLEGRGAQEHLSAQGAHRITCLKTAGRRGWGSWAGSTWGQLTEVPGPGCLLPRPHTWPEVPGTSFPSSQGRNRPSLGLAGTQLMASARCSPLLSSLTVLPSTHPNPPRQGVHDSQTRRAHACSKPSFLLRKQDLTFWVHLWVVASPTLADPAWRPSRTVSTH